MPKKVMIAGGGTGGHIYPGIAIARALEAIDPLIEVEFVGSRGGLEEKLVPKENYTLHSMKIGKLNYSGGVFGKVRTLLGMPWVFLQCLRLLNKHKPAFVLGVGGFASGPFVATAALLGYPTGIWEPNAYPGLTNRWLSGIVKTSFVVFSEAAKYLKSKESLQVGLPIRPSLEEPELSLTEKRNSFNLLIFGGSQGARAINEAMAEAVKQGDWRQGIEIVHQTGRWDFEKVKTAYQGLEGIEALEFLFDMDQRYAWADVVICRSGASTLAELAACGKAAILIPLPTAADDHQRKNAETLVSVGAAEMILQPELTSKKLIETILSFKADVEKRQLLQRNIKGFHQARAAQTVAQLILERSRS